MSTIDTSTWSPDADLNVVIEGIPLNADASIAQTWFVLRALMAAVKGDGDSIKSFLVPFTGATASADGASGFVPAPDAGDEGKFLKGDGTWDTPQDTTYDEATTTTAGLMSAADKTKLNGIASGAQVNVIETVKVNNSALTVTNKAVNVSVPLATTTTPKANGTASVGSETAWAKGDHVHPLQTSVSGNAGTASALASSFTISLSGDVSGSVSTNGTGTAAITATVADDSHNHVIANVDGLQTALDGKAPSSHSHAAGDVTSGTFDAARIPNLDASKIASGTIDIARLPAGALERLMTVANQAARYALTTADVQLGDTVKQLDTGTMYIVVDTSKLNSADGYVEYTAGSAASVPWSGVTSKPSTFPPSSHTHGSITNDGKLGTASRVVVTDGNKVIGVSSITTTNLGYLTDVTANIQGQIDGKADSATTLAGYGITDARIASGTIILGANAITPVTSVAAITDSQIAALFENDGIDPDDPPVANPERAVLCADGVWRYIEQIPFPL